jgi:hypothetical protein
MSKYASTIDSFGFVCQWQYQFTQATPGGFRQMQCLSFGMPNWPLCKLQPRLAMVPLSKTSDRVQQAAAQPPAPQQQQQAS